MEKPLISFIITGYDMPVDMLQSCIESILALSLQPTEREIILVDDGSHDSPMAVLKKYDEKLIYIRQQHQGLSVARNTGIRIATGSYLQFIDGDDQLLPLPYEHCIDIVRTHQPEMVVFDLTHTTDVSTSYHDAKPQSGSSYMRHQNIRGSACGYLFQRNILGDLRFTPGIYHEDEEFTPLLLLRAEAVCVSSAKAYLYRQRYGSITTDMHIRKRLQRLEDAKAVILRLNDTADRLPTGDRLALRRRVAQLTMDYLYNIIRQTSSRHYLERKIEELRKQNLFPLPDRNYTAKYTWFRKMTNSPAGISVLMRIVPIIQSIG